MAHARIGLHAHRNLDLAIVEGDDATKVSDRLVRSMRASDRKSWRTGLRGAGANRYYRSRWSDDQCRSGHRLHAPLRE